MATVTGYLKVNRPFKVVAWSLLFACTSPLVRVYKPPKLGGWGSERPTLYLYPLYENNFTENKNPFIHKTLIT